MPPSERGKNRLQSCSGPLLFHSRPHISRCDNNTSENFPASTTCVDPYKVNPRKVVSMAAEIDPMDLLRELEGLSEPGRVHYTTGLSKEETKMVLLAALRGKDGPRNGPLKGTTNFAAVLLFRSQLIQRLAHADHRPKSRWSTTMGTSLH